MASQKQRRERKRAGSQKRDSEHRVGGGWTSLAIPSGVDMWQPKANTNYKIDLIPYEVGNGNPFAEPGLWYYERTYFRHRAVGANNDSYVCPAKTAGKPCPICEQRAEVARDPEGDEKLVGDLKPQERQLWLVFDHGEPEKGVQLFEFSHWNFGKPFDERRKMAEEDEDYITNFDDWDAGSSLKIRFSEEKMGSNSYLKLAVVDFKFRKDGLHDKDLLDHGICLDDLPKIEDYDKLYKILHQIEDEDEKPKSSKGRSSKGKPKDDDEPPKKEDKKPPKKKEPTADEFGIERGDDVIYEGKECTVMKVSGDGTSLTLMDADDEIHKAVAPDEVEKPGAKKPKADDAEESDDDPPFEDDDAEPAGDDAAGDDDDWDDDWD